MARLTVLAAALGVAACLVTGCTSDEDPAPVDGPGIQDQVPLGPDDGGPPDPQPVSAITLPPFGTDAPLISTYLQRLAEACGGDLCVEVAYQATPEGAQVSQDACFVFGGSPEDTIDRGETLTLFVDCLQQPQPEEDGGEVFPPEDGGGG